MEIKVLKKEEIDEAIAEEIIQLVQKNPKCILGLATGSSPLGVYSNLVRAYKDGRIEFKDVHSFNLDEYVGLDENHPQSYHYFMEKNLFSHIDIKPENTYFPSDKEGDCYFESYDQKIMNQGGIDFQILGIGSNGHIAFNEPGTSFKAKTHIVKLKESTIRDNSRFFASIDEVPQQAISMGLDTIIKAKRIVLIATGKNKKDAITKLVTEEENENLPASILRIHPNVTIYCDEEAVADLNKEYIK